MELRPSEYWAIEKVKFSKHCRAIQHLWEEGKSSPVGLPQPQSHQPGGRGTVCAVRLRVSRQAFVSSEQFRPTGWWYCGGRLGRGALG